MPSSTPEKNREYQRRWQQKRNALAKEAEKAKDKLRRARTVIANLEARLARVGKVKS